MDTPPKPTLDVPEYSTRTVRGQWWPVGRHYIIVPIPSSSFPQPTLRQALFSASHSFKAGAPLRWPWLHFGYSPSSSKLHQLNSSLFPSTTQPSQASLIPSTTSLRGTPSSYHAPHHHLPAFSCAHSPLVFVYSCFLAIGIAVDICRIFFFVAFTASATAHTS